MTGKKNEHVSPVIAYDSPRHPGSTLRKFRFLGRWITAQSAASCSERNCRFFNKTNAGPADFHNEMSLMLWHYGLSDFYRNAFVIHNSHVDSCI